MDFARDNGIEVKFGNPEDEQCGKNIILPEDPEMISVKDLDLDKLRVSLIKNCTANLEKEARDNLTDTDIQYLADETGKTADYVRNVLKELYS